MLMSRIVLIVLLFFVPLSSSMSRFSTKTPYIFKQNSIENFPGFEAKKVWAILRHGTRLPSKKLISRYNGLVDIKEQILSNSKNLSERQRAAFERWMPMNIDLEQQKFLTKQGEKEQFQLGARFRERFPKLFEENSSFTFKHTPTQRTQVSAEKFIEGIFPGSNKFQSTVVAQDDPVLRPYKGCKLWRQTVKKNKEVSLKEKREFAESEHVKKLIDEFREFTQIDHLTLYDLENIFTSCGFETSWQYNLLDGKSTWCSLFQNDQQLRVMEYLKDLEYYWIDGPGFEITRKVACKTVQDIFDQIDPSIDEQKLSFYFTHSGTILKLLTFLEIYKDDYELTAESFRDDRLWKTSNIDTFSSNLAVILYDSEVHGPHVQLLHQEEAVNLPKCQMNEHKMCSWENFKQAYKKKDCKLQDICRTKDEL